jgi:hypothetical protein
MKLVLSQEPENRCKIPKRAEGCSHYKDKKHTCHFKRNGCGKLICEICGEQRVVRDAKKSAERLWAYKELMGLHGDRAILDHVVLSPGNMFIKDNETYKRLRKDASEYAGMLGAVAYSLVFHGYRIKEEYKTLFRAYKSGGGSGGIWSWLRSEGTVNDARYWSPHFHLISVGYLRNSDSIMNNHGGEGFNFYQNTGWIYKKISRDLSSLKALTGLLMYQLNHSTVWMDPVIKYRTKTIEREYGYLSTERVPYTTWKQKGHVITYNGDISYNKMGMIAIKKKKVKICPTCEEEVKILDVPWEELERIAVKLKPLEQLDEIRKKNYELLDPVETVFEHRMYFFRDWLDRVIDKCDSLADTRPLPTLVSEYRMAKMRKQNKEYERLQLKMIPYFKHWWNDDEVPI